METKPIYVSFENYSDDRLVERFYQTFAMLVEIVENTKSNDQRLPSLQEELLGEREIIHRELSEIALLLEQRGIKP